LCKAHASPHEHSKEKPAHSWIAHTKPAKPMGGKIKAHHYADANKGQGICTNHDDEIEDNENNNKAYQISHCLSPPLLLHTLDTGVLRPFLLI
jgi:hypothetical protein